MPECHAGAKWGDLGPINNPFMIRRASTEAGSSWEGSGSLNPFLMSPTYYGGHRI
ncbi:hypothetical protein ACVIN2_007784 [Bradyrhizobium sp. USDA 3650]